MSDHMRVFTIGALAKATGIAAPAIRYYEDIGLLPHPQRSEGKQRRYDQQDVERLTFVRRCRAFGFSIEQVRQILALSISADRDCRETRDIAQAHLDSVRQKVGELRELEVRLKAFVVRCNEACAGGPGSECIILKDVAAAAAVGCCSSPAALPPRRLGPACE